MPYEVYLFGPVPVAISDARSDGLTYFVFGCENTVLWMICLILSFSCDAAFVMLARSIWVNFSKLTCGWIFL